MANGNFYQQTRMRYIACKKKSRPVADAFYKDLEFGTGGLRGIMGVGTNRMNKYSGYGNTGLWQLFKTKVFPVNR
jgi:phosphoglucomutase